MPDRPLPLGPGARGVVVRAMLALLVGGVLVATACAAVAMKHEATGSLRTELTLDQTSLYVNSYRYYGQSFARGSALGRVELAQQETLADLARRRVAQFAAATSLGRPLVAMNDRLEQLMAQELQLVRHGRLRAASAFDTRVVTPQFDALAAMMGADGPELDRRAKAASADAGTGILAAVLGAGAVLLVTLAAYERTRRRQVRRLTVAAERERSRGRFVALVRHATDLVVVVDADGRVNFETPSAGRILGYGAGGLVGEEAATLVHPDDRHLLELLCQPGGPDGGELRFCRADGEVRWFEVRASHLPDDPEIAGTVINGRDVTEQKQLEAELRHQALHDTLTGLANRALFNDRVGHALARHARSGDAVAVLLIDLDDFKSVNDVFGHGTGDELLAEVATRLLGAVRRGDTVARLGGDEFAILLDPPLRGGEAELVAERIVGTMSAAFELPTGGHAVGASVGIAFARADKSPEELLRDADLAMYVAKQQGKGRSVTFEEGMHHEAQERLALTSELAAAVQAGDQLVLHYQPIVRLDTEEAVGVEALVRWQHPTRGTIPPLSFIPLAEDSGLIVEIGRHVLREATRQLAAWAALDARLGELTMSVNVSARQLEEPGFVDEVRAALEGAGLSAGALVLELTESVLLQQADAILDRLVELRALGVRIAIDDFGTGYSSLGYLKRLPVDLLKVDRGFTVDLAGEGRHLALAEAIVRIGASLELETVAEGIEQSLELEHLRGLRCTYGQGFLFARPLPADDCLELLRAGARAGAVEPQAMA